MEKFKQFITEKTHPKDLEIGEYYKIYPLKITHPMSKAVSYKYYVIFDTVRQPIEDVWTVNSSEYDIVIKVNKIQNKNSVIVGRVINPSKYNLYSNVMAREINNHAEGPLVPLTRLIEKGNGNIADLIPKEHIVYFSPERKWAHGTAVIEQRYKLEKIDITPEYDIDVIGDLF